MNKKKLILIELNEINFDVVSYYLDKGIRLPGFKKIIDGGLIQTSSETEYKNLEPWIQWPSVHTGKQFEEHKVFRLGDFINSNEEQIFEKVESLGFDVGAISPMNASNNLKKPAYFIPDPWTKTLCDGSYLSKSITSAIVQTVNDNSASKITISSIFNLGLAFILLVNPGRYFSMVKYAFGAIGNSWRKALFLDMLLYEIHKTLFKRKDPNFSTIFLNAGAHIQHHYFFNSPFVTRSDLSNPNWYIENDKDPILEMLKVYDSMLLDIFKLPNTEFILATGLSQKPYEKLKFYYRLKNHKLFLKNMGVDFIDVIPRMTRDFLITFNSVEEAKIAEKKIKSVLVDSNIRLFDQVDNRGKDIFVVLTYPDEISDKSTINMCEKNVLLKDMVTFVAIKNGEHQSKGFAFFSKKISKFSPQNNSHVSEIHNTILSFFRTSSNEI